MFDVQVFGHPGGEMPRDVLASISSYYGRVTTAARPMNRLIALAMLGTLGSIIAQIARGEGPGWAGWASLALAVVPITLALVRTVPHAVRLGAGRDTGTQQSALARSICRDHIVCAASILALLVVQLAS